MIKAVLWDFGGVLTTSPFEAFNRFEAARGIPRDFIRTINASNGDSNAWAQFESSQIGLEEFDSAFAQEAEAAGHPIRGAEVLALLAGDIRPPMVNALRLIRQRYRTACLTNNVKGAGEGPGMAIDTGMAAAVAEVMSLFEMVIESSKVGLRKPDPRIYQLACDQLALAPEQVLFLDDLGINLKPARAMGMSTIKVTSMEQALAELAQQLDLDLSVQAKA